MAARITAAGEYVADYRWLESPSRWGTKKLALPCHLHIGAVWANTSNRAKQVAQF